MLNKHLKRNMSKQNFSSLSVSSTLSLLCLTKRHHYFSGPKIWESSFFLSSFFFLCFSFFPFLNPCIQVNPVDSMEHNILNNSTISYYLYKWHSSRSHSHFLLELFRRHCHNWFHSLLFLSFFILIYFERDRKCDQGRGRERGESKNPKQALNSQCRAQCGAQTHELWDQDLNQSQTLNQLNHPEAAVFIFTPSSGTQSTLQSFKHVNHALSFIHLNSPLAASTLSMFTGPYKRWSPPSFLTSPPPNHPLIQHAPPRTILVSSHVLMSHFLEFPADRFMAGFVLSQINVTFS